MKYTLSIFLIIFISGCSTKFQPIAGKTQFVNYPALGKVSSVEIGSPLLSKAKVETRDGYTLNKPVSKLANPLHPINSGFRVELAPDKYYLAERDKQNLIYYPINSKSSKSYALGVELQVPTGFSINQEKQQVAGFIRNGIKIPLNDIDITPSKVNLINNTNFKQELIYNGKSGNVIRLMYREFSGDMARPAFSQDLTYDLAESRIIGFQGVRLEVIKTTNIKITYKVLNGFPNSN